MSFENAMPVDMFLLDTLKNVVVARRTKVAPVECPRWFPVRLKPNSSCINRRARRHPVLRALYQDLSNESTYRIFRAVRTRQAQGL